MRGCNCAFLSPYHEGKTQVEDKYPRSVEVVWTRKTTSWKPRRYRVQYLDGEGTRVDVLGHLGKDTDVPVLEQRRVVGGPGADVHRVRRVGCPSRADDIRLVEHVLVPFMISTQAGGGEEFDSVEKQAQYTTSKKREP